MVIMQSDRRFVCNREISLFIELEHGRAWRAIRGLITLSTRSHVILLASSGTVQFYCLQWTIMPRMLPNWSVQDEKPPQPKGRTYTELMLTNKTYAYIYSFAFTYHVYEYEIRGHKYI